MGRFSIGKSDETRINLTSLGFKPTLLQNSLWSNIVALIINVLEHLSKTDLHYGDISNGLNSTLATP
jgi:hypothetical protein